MTLSSARDFKFEAVSDLTARLSILLQDATLGNRKMREIENEAIAKNINDDRIFEPKIEDPLDDFIEISLTQNIKNLCIRMSNRQFKQQTKLTLSTCRLSLTK